jgi:uncharacterized protein GlcG (DUF336 family)
MRIQRAQSLRLFLAAAVLLLTLPGCRREARSILAGLDATAPPANVPQRGKGTSECEGVPNPEQLKQLLQQAASAGQVGGLFEGRKEWAAAVNRDGKLCSVAASTEDASAPWPASQAIAKAKASTANAFSTDEAPMSTARLYTLSQPGHSLWGAGAGNPLNAYCVDEARDGREERRICGGTIVLGGGVPLYRGERRIGGLGVSGDTPCADHEVAKRMRDSAGLNPSGGAFVDDITYSSADGASIYTHPLCPNTWRNQKKVGDEPVAAGY